MFSYYNQNKDLLSLSRLYSSYLLAQLVHIPEGKRHQININTFIRAVSMPKNPKGTILIIQGGARHMNNNSYYIRLATAMISQSEGTTPSWKNLASKNGVVGYFWNSSQFSGYRVFTFEKLGPMLNFEFAHDVEQALKFIRANYPGPVGVIGFSLGGVLLWTYLGLGYDSADVYIPVCCPLDLPRFFKIINEHGVFKLVQTRTCRAFNAKDHLELLKLAGSSEEKHQIFMDEFIPKLNATISKWHSKTIYVISSDDPITSLNDLKLLEKEPQMVIVKNGWHCCMDSIWQSIQILTEQLNKLN